MVLTLILSTNRLSLAVLKYFRGGMLLEEFLQIAKLDVDNLRLLVCYVLLCLN